MLFVLGAVVGGVVVAYFADHPQVLKVHAKLKSIFA